MRIARVTWRDAAYYRDLPAHASPTPCDMQTVGWLIADEAGYIALAHETCEDGSYRSVTSIPREWIEGIEFVGEDDLEDIYLEVAG